MADDPRTTSGAHPRCPTCDAPMTFSGGEQTHDVWAERYECARCGTETTRVTGRGSI